ncbi:MAG: modification methylase [Alistipes sp.]|nr:modification methylase [Alistipes sp.]
MVQSKLFNADPNETSWKVTNFSADSANVQKERLNLENRYWKITEITDKFSRQSVSYQLSKKDRLHRWLKYKEGFSSELVRILFKDLGLNVGDNVLDPFMGSGTTALVAQMEELNSIGFDVLPMSKIAILAKSAVYDYDLGELNALILEIEALNTPHNYNNVTPYISTTKDGYPEQTAKDLAFYEEYFAKSNYSKEAMLLLKLCTLNTLENIGYSKKDGQYLRWDCRCPKIIRASEERQKKGKKPFAVILNKGELPSLKIALLNELKNVVEDIQYIQTTIRPAQTKCNFIEGSALFEITSIEANSVNGVVSSPPYCNRYDYTRTYAMELAYLKVSDIGVRKMRQDLLSCTVESKSKIETLKNHYSSIGREQDFDRIYNIIKSNPVLHEILEALKQRDKNGEVNNRGIIPMVEGYFTELTFIFAELYRVCVSGAKIAFVNDNVRYAGEVIPVDYLTTMLAESLGFVPRIVYTLKQQKGNSSQQMKKYGKVNLRKSITIWEKP